MKPSNLLNCSRMPGCSVPLLHDWAQTGWQVTDHHSLPRHRHIGYAIQVHVSTKRFLHESLMLHNQISIAQTFKLPISCLHRPFAIQSLRVVLAFAPQYNGTRQDSGLTLPLVWVLNYPYTHFFPLEAYAVFILHPWSLYSNMWRTA